MKNRFIFLGIMLFISLLFALGHPEAGFSAYDGTLPADNSKIASGPAMIRENQRALKEDAIVNAGRLATESIEDIRGVYLSCVASTTSTAMVTSGSANLNVGTATGVYHMVLEGGAVVNATGTSPGYGQTFTYLFSVRVGTTTELIADPVSWVLPDSTTATWVVGIATSSTRGEIPITAQGRVGAEWKAYARKRVATW